MSDKLVEDEVVDGSRKADPVDHPMRLVDVFLMSSMAMSTDCLEVRVDQDVEVEDAKLRIVTLNIPMMTR